MKVIEPASLYEDLQSGIHELARQGTYSPLYKYPSVFFWSEENRHYVFALKIKEIDFQVYVAYGGWDRFSEVQADIDGVSAVLSVFPDRGGFFGKKKGAARLDFAEQELNFSDTRELPVELQKLAEAMLEALGQATQLCIAAAEEKKQQRQADEDTRRTRALEDIKKL
jgi:hypothetical protein